jgi:PASTA domain
MKTRSAWCAAPLALAMSTHLAAQVTSIPEPDFLPIQAAVTNIGPTATTLLIQKSYTLQQNEMRRVFGRVEITGNTGTSPGTGNNTDYASGIVECAGPNGFVGEGEAGQNYEGPTKAAGPDYPTTGHLALYPLVLIQAPTAGTYLCKLFASTGKPETVVGRAFQGDNTTWLRVSAPIATYNGLHEIKRPGVGAPIAANTPFTDAFTWGAPPGCSETGAGQACLYLGVGALPSVDVLAPEAPWSPATDAAFVGVNASLQVTLCGKTSSCSAASKPQSKNTNPVVVESHLELIQLNAAGGTCQRWPSPTQRSTIGNAPHHYMIYHKLSTVPVYPSCGTPQFVVKLFVNWLSGGTAKIDGPGATHAIAFTSYHGTAPPVPNVIGLTESVASSTLATSGYSLSLVSSAYGTAPLGSVIAQDPSPPTIELPGSGVNLTLSTGSVTVPKVTNLAQNTAIHEIAAVGLVAKPILQPGCKDPGTVLAQSPAAGSGVAPGSTVSLTVNSGKTTNGSACAAD